MTEEEINLISYYDSEYEDGSSFSASKSIKSENFEVDSVQSNNLVEKIKKLMLEESEEKKSEKSWPHGVTLNSGGHTTSPDMKEESPKKQEEKDEEED